MKKALTKSNNNLYHYKDLIKTEGKNEYMYGDCTWLRGDCSGLRGDCTWLRGDFDNCDLTKEDRIKGVEIKDLIVN